MTANSRSMFGCSAFMVRRQNTINKVYGWNSRLDELQAAVLRIKLPTLDEDNARRAAIAERYSQCFQRLPLKTPPVFSDRASVYHQYVMETPQRDELRKYLENRGIGTGMDYPLPLHEHEAWSGRGMPSYSLPESERYARENLAIPSLRNSRMMKLITSFRP
jgi:dTDP-4-amino-4,6-dideoxygalactose transaminase